MLARFEQKLPCEAEAKIAITRGSTTQPTGRTTVVVLYELRLTRAVNSQDE